MDLRAAIRHVPFVVLILSSAVLNVALAARLQRQRDTIADLTPATVLRVGQQVATLDGVDATGKYIRADYSKHERTLLYVYSATCAWCKKNTANMTTVFGAALSQDVAVFAVSLSRDRSEHFISDRGLAVPVLFPTDAALRAYGFGGTPHTFVISREGRVIKTWRGAYVSQNAKDLSEYFGVSLPGLTDAAPASR